MDRHDGRTTRHVADFIAGALDRELSSELLDRAKMHLLDAIIAMLSGATLPPGRLGVDFVTARSQDGESTVVSAGRGAPPEYAAFANAMCAHADETDDVHPLARIHAGASVVPAALAMAEECRRTGPELLASIVCGYDVGCAINISAWPDFHSMQRSVRAPQGLGQTFAAAAAAAAAAGLAGDDVAQVLSYAAQQVSGITTFFRDVQHVGKAFASAAMQARSGVFAVELVRFGLTDITDVFDGSPSLFDAFGDAGDLGLLKHALGSAGHLLDTDIKRYPVGMPIQAAAEALLDILHAAPVAAAEVESVEVRLPTHGAHVVGERAMPDISLPYVLSAILVDGELTFAAAHDYERFRRPQIRELMARIELVADTGLDPDPRGDPASRRTRIAVVSLKTLDGRVSTMRVDAPLGSRHRPMTWEAIEQKARETLTHMARSQVDALVATARHMDEVLDVRELRPLLGRAQAADRLGRATQQPHT